MTRIDTVDQLDALPIGSVILDLDQDAWRKHLDGWWIAGDDDQDTLPFDAEYLPATVLHVPGRDLVQEAQADAWDEGFRAGLVDNPYRDEAPRQG